MDEYLDDNMNNQKERPQTLLVLCILSWTSIGFSLITSVVSFFRGPISPERMEEAKGDMLSLISEATSSGMESIADIFSKLQHMTEVYNANHYSFYGLSIIVLLVGLGGVVWMFLGKKQGFHLYIAYSLLSVIQIYLFLVPAEIPSVLTLFGLLFSGLFIFLYSRNLSWMK
jgi:hypothetical protein